MTRTSRATAERYPLAMQAIARLLAPSPAPAPASALAPGPLGPQILRAPPEIQRRNENTRRSGEEHEPAVASEDVDELLGELVDMVFVSAEQPSSSSAGSEVHLVFKADVLGGLHLRLKKLSGGMHATFIVEDAATRRAVLHQVDRLVDRLRARGFAILGHDVLIGSSTS